MNDLEEIGLDDDNDSERGRSTDRTAQRGSSGLNSLRDLTHAQAKRPTVQTNLSVQTPSSQNDLLAAPQASSRSRKTQSTPSLPRPTSSRGPSPARHSIVPNGSVATLGSGYRPSISPSGPKRTSWQRKTSEQLEEEYDSDDEVPPDAIFYNVPLSPRSAKAYSASASPDRETSGKSDGTATPPDGRSLQKSHSTTSIAINGVSEKNGSELRSKSWSDAMRNLSDEAKELSEALERHADEEMLETEKRLQQRRSAPAASKKNTPPASTKHSVELPPLQVSNGIIDPLPISKEKEAVLSRTRPSWLPPKSKEEEKRHLKEYQKMMRRSQEAERKRAQKERQEQESRDRLHNEFSNVWESQIIPNWGRACRLASTRELWWQGIAPRCRGLVWSLSFGNHLAVSAETYKLALKRAKDIEIGLKKAPTMYTPREREIFSSIQRDVKVAFPELKIFQENGPLHESLVDVLMAYAMYRSDVGYVYGTHTVAAMLLLNQSPEQAFLTLANMLNRPLPLSFFTQDEGAISRSYALFLKAFQYKLPSLHKHIHQNLRLQPNLYLEPMFLTLFSLHCPVDITSRIWDIYSFEGDSFLVRTAVGIMTVLESKLYGSRDEVLKILGWNAGILPLGKEDEFMAVVRSAGKEEVDKPAEGF
ncbi:rab-GTPase-TBC domain-containing protein [Sphaerosporella brunnea]|uniref:Rab-GTPase-TBC domain-containing protein n=1 Tax=Sphaerosporella brunnea TaxID=1250544 RepID=A0A5J5ESR2_9PEZI|nr:rab-GTPase-TBC domain-containing protein [Sphaerosporella brunnea]